MADLENTQSNLMIEKRDGSVVPFDPDKIEAAVAKAAVAAGKSQGYIEDEINGMIGRVTQEINTRFSDNDFIPNVENIHDIVEKHLMKDNHYEVAKAYILHRAEKRRIEVEERKKISYLRKLTVVKSDGRTVLFNPKKVKETILRCSDGLDGIDSDAIFEEAVKNIYDGIKSDEIDKALILATTSLIELEPNYGFLAARMFQQRIRKEVLGASTQFGTQEAEASYRESFIQSINLGVKNGLMDERLMDFDLDELAQYMDLERDSLFKYMGLQTLYERYFVKLEGRLMELPQVFWMRVAMGLAINEDQKEKRAKEFYDVMSKLLYVPSTPTLFHSGLTHPQLSSCYLTCIDDDLKDIFKSYADNSQLSKWSGGIGNDWTNVRSLGALINSTKVESQGTIPFLKIANDTTVAINRSGKRRGATVAYLETWHLDIEDFLDLRKNTGDDRRRTHDMNTANWIPDLFMQRVENDENWTLFSPDETPDLHDLYGRAFNEAYVEYERKAKRGELTKTKTIPAKKLYRKMLGMLFETGHPWFCFKDACNVRSPQDHVGVVHSSNLCTEITLNTSPSKLIEEVIEDGKMTRSWDLGEVAVCNLGSLVLPRFVGRNGKINRRLLRSVVRTAMRMLDNVIDINYYPIPEAYTSNMKHRPVGLGVMGLQDALFNANINYEDSEEFVDELQEVISYYAIESSCELAEERGAYPSFEGSKWDRGIFPLDTISLLEEERGEKIDVSRTQREDWDALKAKVKKHGMRNGNTMAIAPTATISNIAGGYTPCTEAIFKNIFVKANMSGEFTVVNEYLIADLKKAGLWNKGMLDNIKYHDGSIQDIESIPVELRNKYKEAFEINPKKSIDLAAVRAKWIDQSQSHNIFLKGKSGKLLAEVYMYAWKKGLKTTYYLRTLGASGIEKSTLDSKFGLTQKRGEKSEVPATEVKMCKINDPDCEACQ